MEFIKTNDGLWVPVIGFGTYQLKGSEGVNAIISAYNQGYRWFDSAYNYENEGTLGRAIKMSGVAREKWLITSKLPGRYHDRENALKAIQESLYRSGLDYLDFYLIHWPNPLEGKYVEAWETLIEARKMGLIRSIGVSNFNPEHLKTIVEATGVVPSINQIELHPNFNQQAMREVNQSYGIVTQAWSPIGRNLVETFKETVQLQRLSQKYGKSAIQIILKWHLQLGVVPLPKSSNPTRQFENIDLFDFSLTDEEMGIINALTKEDGRLKNQDPSVYQEF